MKIADYGKAITSYIESPTTAQKLQAKEKAQTLGRTFLAEGSEDIVEPPKSMQVDTTTKGPDLFTLDKFKDKAEIYILALNNRAMPLKDIKSALNKFTKQGLEEGTFTIDEAIKVVKNLKFEVEDRAQKQRLRDNIIAGTGTLSREDFAGGTKLMDEYLGAQKEYQKAVDNGFQGTYEEFLRYKSSGSFAEGGRVKFQDGLSVQTLDPVFPTKDPTSTDFKPLDIPGAIIPPLAIGAGAKRLKDIFFSKEGDDDKKEITPSDDKGSNIEPPKGPKNLDNLLNTIELGKATKDIKEIFNKVDKEYIDRDKGYANRINNLYSEKFANKIKKIVDNKYGGNVARLADDLDIERVRINTLFNKHGLKAKSEGRTTVQNIFLDENKEKLSIPELTNNIKGNETYLINRAKERFVNYNKNKNKFLNYKDIAEIIGVELPDKTAQDFFQTKLRNANKKVGIETKPGLGREVLYNLGDSLNALTKVNLAKPIIGTGRVHDKLRSEFERGKDKIGYNTRTEVLRIIRDAQNNIFGGEKILKAGEQYGHAEAIANQQKYPKLFKNSNAADISTLVFQDPILNQDVLQAYGSTKTGIEQKRQPFLKKLESLVGKKATSENIQIANEALNGLNNLNDLARIQIKRFQKTNRFVRDQENRIPDFELILPKEGGTFKSGFLKIDMSNIDPSVSVGRILEINPEAETFNDLNKQEKEIYKENLKNQMTDYLSYFYTEAGADKDDIETFADAILEAKIGTRVKKAQGGLVYGKYAEQIAKLS